LHERGAITRVLERSGVFEPRVADWELVGYNVAPPDICPIQRGGMECASTCQNRPGSMDQKHHIAVVDDEADLRSSVAEYLQLQGFEVSQAADGAGLRRLMGAGPVDLVLLDLRMPGEDGIAVLRSVREQFDLPVIMVTAMGDPIDRIVGLEVGADDYIVKPFDLRELLARIRTVLRRMAQPKTARAAPQAQATRNPNWVRVGRVELDLAARSLVESDGKETPLTAMEFDLLKVLVSNPNRVLTRDQLLDLAHDDSWEPFDRSIDIRIARLRRKVERDPASPEVIRTVRGAGYMFVPKPSG
jgi:two-component system, OmpR family, phosphate regulon response regulator OmpR